MKRTVIPLPDYERIFRSIYSVLNAEVNTAGSCVLFSVLGAAILKEHYKIKALPVVGAAAYTVISDIKSEIAYPVSFGIPLGGELISTEEAFHCYLVTDGIVIDFMAPIFEENLKARGFNYSFPRKMFQKPLSEMAKYISPYEMRHEGAFYLNPNPQLQSVILPRFEGAYNEYAQTCIDWYRRPPKKIQNCFLRKNGMELKFKGLRIEGVW